MKKRNKEKRCTCFIVYYDLLNHHHRLLYFHIKKTFERSCKERLYLIFYIYLYKQTHMTCMCLQISYKYREKRINVFDLNIYV